MKRDSRPRLRRFWDWAALGLFALGLGLFVWYLLVNWVPKWRQNYRYVHRDSSSNSETAVEESTPYFTLSYPTETLFTSAGRRTYQDGELSLRIPALGYEGAVQNGTDDACLQKGPGLYEESALPSLGNPNVCIAAHRGVYGAEFYKLDTLAAGDTIELDYDGYRFTYTVESFGTVDYNDWSIIRCTDESTVTLTTCEMDTSSTRLYVRGKLTDVALLDSAKKLTPAELEAGVRDGAQDGLSANLSSTAAG